MDAGWEKLLTWFRDKEGVVVAFSGGVDSAIVAKAAATILNSRAIAATARSATLLKSELESAIDTASEVGIRHVVFDEDEFEEPGFVENSPMRCYHCRKGLVAGLRKVAAEHAIELLVDGANADDIKQHRPGLRAMRESGVRSPLLELGVGKEDVRRIAAEVGLTVADKPSMACLASRIPYGERITKEKLTMIEEAEEYLRGLRFRVVRVRSHEGTARIEVAKEEIPKALRARKKIVERLKRIGFVYVTLDLEGYRSGSMDEALSKR